MIDTIAAGAQKIEFVISLFPTLAVGLLFILVMTMVTPLYIPIEYERGKIKWVGWCGCGQHPAVVYFHGDGSGFQTIHPDDLGGDRR